MCRVTGQLRRCLGTRSDTPESCRSLILNQGSAESEPCAHQPESLGQDPRATEHRLRAASPQITSPFTRRVPPPPDYPSATTSPPSSPQRTDSTNPVTSTATPTSPSCLPARDALDPENDEASPHRLVAREASSQQPRKRGSAVQPTVSRTTTSQGQPRRACVLEARPVRVLLPLADHLSYCVMTRIDMSCHGGCSGCSCSRNIVVTATPRPPDIPRHLRDRSPSTDGRTLWRWRNHRRPAPGLGVALAGRPISRRADDATRPAAGPRTFGI